MGALHPKVAAWKREATEGREPSDALKKELLATVRSELGPIAVILGKDPGDISTIDDEGSVEEAREAWQHMRASVTTGS